MKLQFFHKAGLVATGVAAGATHLAFSAREEHVHQKNRPVSSNSYAAMEGRRQAGQIDELLKGLKGKSRRQKIEDAYMAATKTHDYGFPQSISPPPANVKERE